MNEIEKLMEKEKEEQSLQKQRLSTLQDRYFICAVVCFCTGHPIAGGIFVIIHLMLLGD